MTQKFEYLGPTWDLADSEQFIILSLILGALADLAGCGAAVSFFEI
jgi:hypothetical protein